LGNQWLNVIFRHIILDGLSYGFYRARRQFGIHRQRQDLPGIALGDREASLIMAKISIGLLHVDGYGIMDTRGNAPDLQERPECIPVVWSPLRKGAEPDYIQMIDRLSIIRLYRDYYRAILEKLPIELRVLPASGVPGVQILQFDPKHGGLEGVETVVMSA
jgi:hypothetical protein